MANFTWFTKYSVSCDWDCHKKRGSTGGEDRIHPAGSPVLAPYDCVVTYGKYSDGASYVQFKYDNGYAHRALHIQSGGRVANGTRVSEGTRVAYSDGRRGTFGAGTSTGQHVHFHGVTSDGNSRMKWQDVPAPYTPKPTGGSSSTLKNIEPEGYPEMFYAVIKKTGAWYLVVPQGNAKPKAVILGANAIKGGDLPVIEFEWEASVNALRSAVDGI